MALQNSSSIDTRRSLKRRKTRKGTRSCWACKRRKVKCTYARPADDVCIGCTRRCLDCVGQEFPEQNPGQSSKSRLVGDRIARLETMIQQLAEQVGSHIASASSPLNPANTSIPLPPSMTKLKHRTLSQALLAAYPSPQDLGILGSIDGNLALYLLQVFVTSPHQLEKGLALDSEKLWETQQHQQYTAETHPVLIARHMLLLANILQHLYAVGSVRSSTNSYQQLSELSRPPRALARRLAEPAATLVTAHDKFTTDTLEGLECLWLEAVYHEHNGSPRRSWLACRRAISAVHLMGFHRRRYNSMAPPKSILQNRNNQAADFQQIWFRLVHSELTLCLALEMPPSTTCLGDAFISVANSVTAENDIAGLSKLERWHATIATHVFQRSQRDSDFEDLNAAHKIHTELEEARSAMPSGWWRTPSLTDQAEDEADDDKHLFKAMMKLRTQIFHFYLLLLTDLPSMLQATYGEPTITTDEHHHHSKHHLNRSHLPSSSRNICVEASRELLSRFIHLRSCERTASYFRLLDHYAWLATATLLLARLLNDHQTMTMKALGDVDYQQHLSDRNMASEAMERMQLAGGEESIGDEDISQDYSGAGTKDSTDNMLPRLLALEASGVAVIVALRKPGGAFLRNSSAVLVKQNQDTLILPLPYVGLVSITPQGQHRSVLSGGYVLLSKTVDCRPIVLDNEAGPRGPDDDGEEECDDDDEASLIRAMKLRRKWSSRLICCGRFR